MHPIEEVRRCDDLRGFVVGCHSDGSNVDFPALLQPKLGMHSRELLKQLQEPKVLPPDLEVCVKHESSCGCRAIKKLFDRYHPALQQITPDYCLSPSQKPHQAFEDHLF